MLSHAPRQATVSLTLSVRQNMKSENGPSILPPEYDIDALLDVDRTAPTAASEIIFALHSILEMATTSAGTRVYRPDSLLLKPEITFMDYMCLNLSMGNGFGFCIEDQGLQTFYRSLRSLREMNTSMR